MSLYWISVQATLFRRQTNNLKYVFLLFKPTQCFLFKDFICNHSHAPLLQSKIPLLSLGGIDRHPWLKKLYQILLIWIDITNNWSRKSFPQTQKGATKYIMGTTTEHNVFMTPIMLIVILFSFFTTRFSVTADQWLFAHT